MEGNLWSALQLHKMRTKRSTSVENVEITTRSSSFSLVPRRFQSKSLVHDWPLVKHFNGDDHEGLQEVFCTTFRLVVFVSAKTELSNKYKATFLRGQNLDLLWTRVGWSWMLEATLGLHL